MGGSNSEAEVEEAEEHYISNIPKLPLFNFNTPTTILLHSPEPSGMRTPPLQTSASVPFGWEEEPGKPRPCTSLVPFSSPKSLELPPRLLFDSTSYHSPTTSFRISQEEEEDCNYERGQLGTFVLGKQVRNKEKQGGFVTSWMKKKKSFFKVKRETGGGSHVFPSSADNNNKETSTDSIGTTILGNSHNNKVTIMKKMKLSAGKFTNPLFHAKSHVWTRICKGLKQVVPWKSKKLKKYGCGWP